MDKIGDVQCVERQDDGSCYPYVWQTLLSLALLGAEGWLDREGEESKAAVGMRNPHHQYLKANQLALKGPWPWPAARRQPAGSDKTDNKTDDKTLSLARPAHVQKETRCIRPPTDRRVSVTGRRDWHHPL